MVFTVNQRGIMFTAHIELTSEPIDLLLSHSSDLNGFEDVESHMIVSYVDQYSSSVIFSDDGFANLEFGPFAGTQFEIQGDRRVLESVGDGFELISAENFRMGSCDVTYRIFATFVVRVKASTKEEATLICQNELWTVVELIEGSTDEPYDFVEISVGVIYPDD
jgi:hypothetical protein